MNSTKPNPAFIANPKASDRDRLAWMYDEVQQLYSWLKLVEGCVSDVTISPSELASLVNARLHPVLEALESVNNSVEV